MSSTWLDLGPERKKVEEVLANFRETKFNGMEYFGSRDETTRQASIDEVDRSDLYIGIIGGRYGSGITRQEYERAHERELRCFIYFKDDSVIEPSGRDADPAGGALLAQFKADLRSRHLIRRGFSSPDELATHVATDLHRWIFDQYLEPVLRSAGEGASARAAASGLLAGIKDLTAVSAVTHRALQAAQLIASVDRAQALARYGFLTDDVYDFRNLIERETRWYVGRTEIFDKLRQFSANAGASGYFCIVADAGLGKTALGAEIAGRFDAPAFFCSSAEGRTTAHQCLRHLCADLILRYDLDHDHIPDSAGKDPNFLVKLLGEAVAKTQAAVWMVVDGLDEADDPERGRNPLLLPASLPANTHVVITQRPTQWRVATQSATRFAVHRIYWDDPGQAADIEAHLRRQAERPEIAAALRSAVPPISTETLVASLQKSSQSNFKYLDYVLADIMEGEPGYRPLSVSSLPAGLERYYEQFWARMGMDRMIEQAWDDWNKLFRPVVALLGVAAEPVTVEWIAMHAGRDAAEVRARVLVPWRRFLAGRGRVPEETWHIVHKSFADFLHGKPEFELETFNARIADYYLADPARWNLHRGYASRHLAAHLHAAGDSDRLAELIRRRDWYDAQLAADPSSALFVDDVGHAWAAAESIDEKAVTGNARAPLLAREAGCAITAATVNSLSSNLRPRLLAQLVKQSVWAPAIALAAIATNPNAGERSRALTALAPELPDAASVRQALPMGRSFKTELERRAPLAALVARLAVVGGSEEALAEADGFDSDEICAAALVAAAGHLDATSLLRAFQRLFAIIVAEDQRRQRVDVGVKWHVNAGVEMVSHLPPDLVDAAIEIVDQQVAVPWANARLAAAIAVRLAVLGDARAVVRMEQVKNMHYRVGGFAAALSQLPPAVRAKVVPSVLEAAASAVEDIPTAEGAESLAAIARYATPELARDALQRTLARLLPRAGLSNGTALGGLVSMLDEDALRVAIEAVRQWDRDSERRAGLTALARRALDLTGPERALALISSIGDSHDTSQALVKFLPHLAQRGHIAAALEAVRKIGRDEFRPQALEAIAPFLSTGDITEALALADRVPDRAGWAHAAGALSERLAELGEPERALGLVRTIRDGAARLASLQAAAARAAAAAGDSDEALMIAREIDGVDRQARAYERLASDLASESLAKACGDMVYAHNASHHTNLWGESFWSLDTARALRDLMPRLSAIDASEAMTLCAALEDDMARAEFTALAASALPAAQRDRHQLAAIAMLRDALAAQDWRLRWTLNDIVPSLAEPALREVLRLVDEELQRARDEQGVETDSLGSSAAVLLTRLAQLGHGDEALQRLARIASVRDEPAQLAQFLDALEPERRQPLIDETLTTLEATTSNHRREEALVALAPLLPPESLERALAIVQSIKENPPRPRAADAIMQRWAAIASADAAFDRAEALQDWAILGGTLMAIAGEVAGQTLERAVQATASITADYWSEPAYAAIASRAAECGMQREALDLAVRAGLHAAPVIEAMAAFLDAGGVAAALRQLDDHYVGDESRARVALAARRAALGDLQGALALADSLADAKSRAAALFRVFRDTRERGFLPLYRAWQQALHAAAFRSREHALEEIAGLAPLARRIGAPRTLFELASAAREVMAAWP